ncbi:MAG: exonuclease domain-containing protein [Chloroflexi bacterium]|nr:exonuclease domain-containing protein [Chloroflexota bacterium]
MFEGKRTYVALDLETTGLDPSDDRITEIGAVRFDEEGRELGVFDQLIDPGRPIPAFTEKLTGITNEDVRGAPAFGDVASDLAAFVGESAVVGQNVRFDLAFLAEAGVEFEGPALDTLRFARILFPEGPGALSDLAAELGVEMPVAHRALADAKATASVFLQLRRRAAALAPEERSSLVRVVALDEPALARELGSEELGADDAFEAPALPERWEPPEPLKRAETPERVAGEEVREALAGAARVVERFEERPQQEEMAEAVAGAFSDGGHWLVEAGTGVGKSLAYLIPAALYALRNGTRVVISTNTIALQEQLLGKDVPALREILREAGAIASPDELRVALLKGRANYLCVQRWMGHPASLSDPDVARLAGSLARWLPKTHTGDRSELRLDGGARSAWTRFSSADADCLSRQHTFVREGRCFLQRARKTAEGAHLVIVNHALLLADLASGGSAIPAYDHLIIDEAHNLEGQATQQFGLHIGARQVTDALEAIHRPRTSERREGGIVATAGLPEALGAGAAGALKAAIAGAAKGVAGPFEAVGALTEESRDDRVSITPGVRSGTRWGEVEEGWGRLDEVLVHAVESSRAAASMLGGEDGGTAGEELEAAAGRLESVRLGLADLVAGDDPNAIVWASTTRDGTGALNSAPLEVGPLLEADLFAGRATVVATSATLAAGGSMAFTADQMGLGDAATLALGSPFDYERSTLLATPTGFPDPSGQGYDEAAAEAITELALASEGRALALFTSHASLRRVAELSREALEGEGISVLVQDRDGAPRQLMRNLIDDPRSVIFGTASFWEGIDIRGEALSLLVIARLPFGVPTDPIHKARSELYDDPFGGYSLPGAILRFRQGFGRLIRDREDRGVVAVLDSRIRTRRYGSEFVGALPECTRLSGSVEEIAAQTREWLSR